MGPNPKAFGHQEIAGSLGMDDLDARPVSPTEGTNGTPDATMDHGQAA
jgi:hypothetical protein